MSEHEPESWDQHRNRARALRRKRTENHPGGRSGRIVVKVSPAERDEIVAQAEAGGVTPARLLRDAVLRDDPPYTAEDLRELITQLFRAQTALRAVGTNLNQMAKATNTTGELADDLAHTLAAVRRYADRVGEVVDHLVPDGL
ncbi:MobC family plasmid mobilization relaxosome protein [Nocardia sp. NPDC048505]|uniref:MobC family plasmid mobilization relaxosome protein n=1 Tax=Nocardia sp. NPDC048505 TaxID=3155756 RepID=UPI0033DA2386